MESLEIFLRQGFVMRVDSIHTLFKNLVRSQVIIEVLNGETGSQTGEFPADVDAEGDEHNPVLLEDIVLAEFLNHKFHGLVLNLLAGMLLEFKNEHCPAFRSLLKVLVESRNLLSVDKTVIVES